MIGAVIGDIIGSVFEWHNTKTTDFKLFDRNSHFTDDTVMTVAIADAILNKPENINRIYDFFINSRIYAYKLKEYGKKYPHAGYGSMFENWISSDSFKPYKSFGNGSAMRVSPIGFSFKTLEETLNEAKKSSIATHNHREGVRGAMAIASSIYLARNEENKHTIKTFVEKKFGYDLSKKLDDIRPTYKFDSSCKGSVPQAIIAFLESEDFEDAIRKSISIGGDSDTIACMTGGIAQAYYKKIPEFIINRVNLLLDSGLRRVINEFNKKYGIKLNY